MKITKLKNPLILNSRKLEFEVRLGTAGVLLTRNSLIILKAKIEKAIGSKIAKS